jgi:hypothetical protein
MPCSAAASTGVWKMPMGQPMQCMRRSMKTLSVDGQRRRISDTVMSRKLCCSNR